MVELTKEKVKVKNYEEEEVEVLCRSKTKKFFLEKFDDFFFLRFSLKVFRNLSKVNLTPNNSKYISVIYIN